MYNRGVHSFITMKKIEISIPDKDHDLLTRIAQDQETKKYSDALIKPLTERIESYAFNTPTDEEVTK